MGTLVDSNGLSAVDAIESQRLAFAAVSAEKKALGVFAPLVGALVFKTSGGFEQSSLWVRFPYTPVEPASVR